MMKLADDLRAAKRAFIANPYPNGSAIQALGSTGSNPIYSPAATAFFEALGSDLNAPTTHKVIAAFDRAIAKAEQQS